MRILIALFLAFCTAQLIFFLITLLVKCKNPAEIKLSEDKIELKILKKGVLPRCFFAKISVKNLYTREESVIKTGKIFSKKGGISFAAKAENLRCGVISAEISEMKSGIFTLFFRKKVDIKANDTLLIMPKRSEKYAPNFAASADESLEKRSTLGTPDGAREYQYGDKLGDIHMKLSAKAGKYMVRERFGNGNGLVKIRFLYDNDPQIAEKNAEILLETVSDMLSNGMNCRIFCGEKAVEIQGDWEIRQAFFEIFSQNSGVNSADESADLEICGGEVRGL